jgi:hypothetical protein
MEVSATGNNTQARKWSGTINNPQECGLDHDAITEKLLQFSPTYACMCDEIATTGTFHTHFFLCSDSPIRFGTLKARFPTAHFEKAYGSAKENRDYITKSGKWANSDKAETSVSGSFWEYGVLPSEKEETNPKMLRLVKFIRDGMSTTEIIDNDPGLAFRVKDIDALRQILLAEKYATENRELTVAYLYGASGAGKTRSIFENHNPREVYRITNYRGGRGISCDGYFGQDVLVFEEFHGQVPIEEMLNYLDIYPLYLPARYNDKVACFTKVYITSNIPLREQYTEVKWKQNETWRALERRIHREVEYRHDGTIHERIINEKGGNPNDK